MKKNIVALVMFFSSIITIGMSTAIRAEVTQNTVGPSLMIGNGTTSIGIDSRFGISENLSIRPFVFIPENGTVFGSSLTYEFESSRASKFQMTPYLGGGVAIASTRNAGGSSTNVFFNGGADFKVTDSIDLKAGIEIPLTSSTAVANVKLGAGFRF
jgi:opacity protein-like surface antigen